MTDELGTRIKEQYENRARYFLPRRTYTIIRIDGKAFHSFTKYCKRPYDLELMNDMDNTAMYLCKHIQGAKFAYVQSDEISILLTDFETITTDAWFNGNIQKIVSVSSSMATSKFNQLRLLGSCGFIFSKDNKECKCINFEDLSNYKLAEFDSRTFTIPDSIEVENYFIWRQKDAVRNSISMTAQSLYSHKQLENKSQSDMQEMCFQKGINWNDMIDGFKRGRTIRKINIDEKTKWVIETPDFLKEREIFNELIPKI